MPILGHIVVHSDLYIKIGGEKVKEKEKEDKWKGRWEGS